MKLLFWENCRLIISFLEMLIDLHKLHLFIPVDYYHAFNHLCLFIICSANKLI